MIKIQINFNPLILSIIMAAFLYLSCPVEIAHLNPIATPFALKKRRCFMMNHYWPNGCSIKTFNIHRCLITGLQIKATEHHIQSHLISQIICISLKVKRVIFVPFAAPHGITQLLDLTFSDAVNGVVPIQRVHLCTLKGS